MSGIPLCSLMQDDDRAQLSKHSRLLDCARRQNLLTDADPENTVVIICSGFLGVHHFLADGRRSISELCGPQDLLDCRRQSRELQGTLIALTKARVCLLDAAVLDQICTRDETFRQAVIDRQREQLHLLRDHCVDIGKKTPLERVASFLFEESRRRGRVGTGDIAGHASISKIDIADYLAVRSETLSRCYSRFVDMELITANRKGMITMLDVPRLRQIANGSMPRGCNGSSW